MSTDKDDRNYDDEIQRKERVAEEEKRDRERELERLLEEKRRQSERGNDRSRD